MEIEVETFLATVKDLNYTGKILKGASLADLPVQQAVGSALPSRRHSFERED